MKIAFIINARLVSGAEEHLLDLAGRLPAHGIEPVFFVRQGGAFEERLIAAGIRSHGVFVPAKYSVPFRLAKMLIQEQPDVVSVNREHNIYPTLAAFCLALPFLKIRPKLVNVFHTPTSRRYPFLASLFDGVIATSAYTGASFWSKNQGLEKITSIIYYGINLPLPQPDKIDSNRERRILQGRGFPVIGMVGELWKNQEELIDAGVALREAFPDITIAIVGSGDTEALARRAANLGLEHTVVLTGRIARQQIPDLFYDLDLSVSTHRNEGFGIVHIESLAACTPVVAYNSGGLVEILEKGGGLLVDGGTEEFVKQVAALLADGKRLRALGADGRKVVEENFTMERMVKSHADYYKAIIGRGDNPSVKKAGGH